MDCTNVLGQASYFKCGNNTVMIGTQTLLAVFENIFSGALWAKNGGVFNVIHKLLVKYI